MMRHTKVFALDTAIGLVLALIARSSHSLSGYTRTSNLLSKGYILPLLATLHNLIGLK